MLSSSTTYPYIVSITRAPKVTIEATVTYIYIPTNKETPIKRSALISISTLTYVLEVLITTIDIEKAARLLYVSNVPLTNAVAMARALLNFIKDNEWTDKIPKDWIDLVDSDLCLATAEDKIDGETLEEKLIKDFDRLLPKNEEPANIDISEFTRKRKEQRELDKLLKQLEDVDNKVTRHT